VVNVQEALQDQGYYRGDVDGQLGQLTRDAIGQYQQDHQLEVTAAIDEPTVQSLGLATEQS
jgi:peptidoglycan hydrolase-like protein with peptidoglycan-binding domain